MTLRICVAGATGWTGSEVARALLKTPKSTAEGEPLALVGAIARKSAGQDIGEALGLPRAGIRVADSLTGVLDSAPSSARPDVLIDYTKPDSVLRRTLEALEEGIHVVIGTSGLSAEDFARIDEVARARGLGVIAAGNFSVTAALAKRFALEAARYLPTCEIIDYFDASKVDAPSGTARELAEALGQVRAHELLVPIEKVHGLREARGATLGGAQVHSVRVPGFVSSFETLFGLPDERLTIRHDAGNGAGPYVSGTLLAARRVIGVRGVVRGLDTLLFAP